MDEGDDVVGEGSYVTPAGGALPPMPWRLRAKGEVVATLHWVDVDRIRTIVPRGLRVVRFLPGRTLGGLFLAEYGPGSEMCYRELIVGAATVWYAGRPCLWVTDVLVDSERSVDGGRCLLGAPKRLARFSWDSDGGSVTVGEPGRTICRLSWSRRVPLWRQRARLVALHRDVRDGSGALVCAHGNEIGGRWAVARVETAFPAGSGLRGLGLGKPVLGVCGTGVELLLGGAPFFPLRHLAGAPGPGPGAP